MVAMKVCGVLMLGMWKSHKILKAKKFPCVDKADQDFIEVLDILFRHIVILTQVALK